MDSDVSEVQIIKSGFTPSYRSVMFFIDGEYLRKGLIEFDLPIIGSIQKFFHLALRYFFKMGLKGEVIRYYWYDAKYNEEHEKYHEQQELFNELYKFDNLQIKTGEIVSTKEGDRQKGVDVLIAVDMLTKAYENHYDVAIFVSGDRDFIPLVKAVKDQAGKQVYGLYYSRSCSIELKNLFDKRGAIGCSVGTHPDIFLGSGAIYG